MVLVGNLSMAERFTSDIFYSLHINNSDLANLFCCLLYVITNIARVMETRISIEDDCWNSSIPSNSHTDLHMMQLIEGLKVIVRDRCDYVKAYLDPCDALINSPPMNMKRVQIPYTLSLSNRSPIDKVS